MILAITKAAGALIIEAANKWPAIPGILPSMLTYIAITPPATVEKPPTITAISSDFVNLEIKGLTKSGASVWPTKIFPETLNVSDPLVPIDFCMIWAIHFTINCIIPK